MAKTCFPLNDTDYLAKDLRLWHIGRTNGIINFTGDDFAVTPDSGMNVKLGPGYIYTFVGTKEPGGLIYGNDEEEALSGYVADSYVRYDYICVEYSEEINDGVAKFVKGTRDMPTPVRDETTYQNIVAVIRVKSNASEISQDDIIDTRMNEEYCGLAVDSLSKIPTDQYYNQFMAFMQTIQDALGEDVAGNLLLMIQENQNAIQTINTNLETIENDIDFIQNSMLKYVLGTDDPTTDNCPNGYFYFQLEE